jgi:uncharacterized phage infection (PIP) family protein YhgE
MFDYKKYWLKLKLSAKKTFAKTGLLSTSNFSQRKNVVYTFVAVTAILTAIVFYLIGSYFGNMNLSSKINGLTKQIAEKKMELTNATESLQTAQNKSTSQQSQITSYITQLNLMQGKLQDCQNNTQILQSSISSLQNISSSLQGQLTNCNANMTTYQMVVQNSVRAVCCSFGDVQAGATKNWQIFSNNIICSGNNTVNCGTGAIS